MPTLCHPKLNATELELLRRLRDRGLVAGGEAEVDGLAADWIPTTRQATAARLVSFGLLAWGSQGGRVRVLAHTYGPLGPAEGADDLAAHHRAALGHLAAAVAVAWSLCHDGHGRRIHRPGMAETLARLETCQRLLNQALDPLDKGCAP